MATVLLNGMGTPEPSPDILRRLRAIHAGLSLRYVKAMDAHWAVTLAWSPDDERRAWVQDGRTPLDRACDIIGYLPMDCGQAEAPSYLERMFRQFPREDVRNMVSGLAAYNETTPLAAAVEEAAAEILDMGDPSGTGKKKRRK